MRRRRRRRRELSHEKNYNSNGARPSELEGEVKTQELAGDEVPELEGRPLSEYKVRHEKG